ncbi:hypothetical protein TI39_contig312g00001 [Zymoseptoria brevis]|uniref:MULE transposase domain-containing protein n=1 Tax=Zymoseptoria brevis TaxID=1047168 RepID=A0A0F4GTM9_9PEZI|nr:hypothetical protein TI39_contig312g00001 [Zymoseptoria brevis]
MARGYALLVYSTYQNKKKTHYVRKPLDAEAFAIHRRRERDGAMRTAIHEDLNANAGTAKDIRNARQNARRLLQGDSTPAEAVVKMLERKGYLFKHEPNHAEYIILDNTYKTNRYNRPLMDIVSGTGANLTIPLGFALVGGEDEATYTWIAEKFKELLLTYYKPGSIPTAPRIHDPLPLPGLFITDRDRGLMNALDAVFPEIPSMICRWHVFKNVQAQARKKWPQVPGIDKASEPTGLKVDAP